MDQPDESPRHDGPAAGDVTDPGVIPPWRVLSSPGPTFCGVADQGRGYGLLFAMLAVELLLVRPAHVVGALWRVPHSPVAALAGLWSIFVNYALGPAVLVLSCGVALYYALRRSPQRLDIWAAASVLTYAWVPHVLVVAAGAVLMAFFGVDHPWLPQVRMSSVSQSSAGALAKALIEFGPSMALAVWAVRSIRSPSPAGASVHVAASGLRRGGPPAAWMRRLAPWGAGALLVAGLLGVGGRVWGEWDALRPLVPGDPLPPFSVRGLDGPSLSSSELRGQVLFVDFWATWCPPCVASMPGIEALHRRYASEGLRVVSVNVEPGDEATVRQFVREVGLSFPIYQDGGTLQARFHVQSYPTSFLVDGRGVVRRMDVGPAHMGEIRTEVERLLAER